ncbi:hypothetical protein FQA39_LY18392 [Lamprigera yunnana]|nr:hypothetical protein FQA39_LY18392 [Lamprigera yunnana]
MDPLTQEIDEELLKIDQKYNNVVQNEKGGVGQLAREFDSLGIAYDNKTIVASAFELISVHRKLLVQLQEHKVALNRAHTANVQLKDKVVALEKEIVDKKNEMVDLRRRAVLTNVDNQQNISEKVTLRNDIRALHQLLVQKEDLSRHRLQQLSAQNEHLKCQIEKNIGQYKLQDDVITSRINTYKQNEEAYKEVILKLQDNNRGLLEEILNLKEEIVLSLIRRDEN